MSIVVLNSVGMTRLELVAGNLRVILRLLLVMSILKTLYVPAGTVRSSTPLNFIVKFPVV